MVEDKKVLLEKVDTLKNVADSLTKSISIEKFSWCREFTGNASHEPMNLCIHDSFLCKENNKMENVGYMLYSLHESVEERFPYQHCV